MGELGHKFWWGVSSSPYQTEDLGGARFKTDWDLFADRGRIEERKGNGTFSYTEFERDIRALKELQVTHYRFGIEWARVEPTRGSISNESIDRYQTICRRLIEEGITPVVALWHWTFPEWLSDLDRIDRHGWLHPDARSAWSEYVDRMVEALSPAVTIFAPQNEPNTQSMMGYLAGYFSPGARYRIQLCFRSLERSAEAFHTAAHLIRRRNQANLVVSIQNIVYWERARWDWFSLLFNQARRFNTSHLDAIASTVDYVGFTYYMREVASPFSFAEVDRRVGENVSDMGWFVDPSGLEFMMGVLWKRYQKPLVIMENGIADRTDEKRIRYIDHHLHSVKTAQSRGIDVIGYFHWSLIDNFEWSQGYGPKFGLYSMDPETRTLAAKPSARRYREWIEKSRILTEKSLDPIREHA